MIRASAEGWARLTLLCSLAAAQLTLLVRSGLADFAIMASLSWLAGGLLLLEREEQGSNPPLQQLSGYRVVPALLLLLWSLLVLSRVARLYDPLLHLLPLASLLGLGLLSGLAWRSTDLASLGLIGALLPGQVLINRFLPTDALASLTAWISSLLLWVLGRPAFSEGRNILLNDKVLVVDASCTGVNTMALCLAAALVLVILLPPPARPPFPSRWRSLAAGIVLGLLAVVMAFVVNTLRIVLLAYTDFSPGLEGLDQWRSFSFWHEGLGANLFSLAAMALTCLLWVLVLELNLRHTRLMQGTKP
ncbi:exosortase/archaeosortase family protein [Synechococcus sp. CS-602]|uniref:archaeosortase/exosortase family protein n=1 Tax=Synechococcaceae TaxID=1890426 RepID=UPI0008FF3CE9|nr:MULTISPECIES: archaeosortase/exosortase family protein [Synechococcaceae]MCT4363347.1 exosortase/archaeosortase family protein [Candidatus Regnicoccus frigidus MAG-AL1]APD48701.1 hypothetical protein BM449_11220 [Synechococcus sp. SynAce01]MCT0205215.1 exosortase/archaeosortase family protein [Synechococcus sp. CS-602]MCT0245684.1 exosortase/archaeosortase family protein [Synechococcus sp. CS-601]MCT4367464.1 exosortase/archaeosortase family protein [Candidatus Regnicoccus frigidus MAG-AL2]